MGILQARILEWAAIPFSRGSSQPRGRTQVSCVAGGFFLPSQPPGKPNSRDWTYINHVDRESEWEVKVIQSCPTFCNPMEFSRPLEWVAIPFSRGSSQPRNQTLVSCTVGRLPVEPQGKPKNTGVGSLSFLQQIFPTQESNWGLLHCRRILYQLNYEGSPRVRKFFSKESQTGRAGGKGIHAIWRQHYLMFAKGTGVDQWLSSLGLGET